MKRKTLAAFAVVGALVSGQAPAATDLSVFDWAGYEDPMFFGKYVEKYGDAPGYTYFGGQDEAFTKLQSGFTADLAHPCSDAVPKWVAAGLLKPIDKSRLKHWNDLLPEIKQVNNLEIDGKLYMVPFDWGNTGLIYRTDKISDAKISLQLLADPAYKGKVAIPANADSAYAMASLATGNAADYTRLSNKQFKEASDYLRKVHSNIRFYWSDPGELDQALKSGEVEMGWAWNQTELNLIWEEIPAKMMRDVDKGIATWVCGYVHLASAKAPDAEVYDFLNALTEPASGKYIIENWGYPHSNAKAFPISDQALVTQYGFDNPRKFFSGSLFFDARTPELDAKMRQEYERIKSGF